MIMAKKTTSKSTASAVAPEHTTIEPVRKNIVRLTAESGWALKSKSTGKVSQSVLTAHVGGYEVLERV